MGWHQPPPHTIYYKLQQERMFDMIFKLEEKDIKFLSELADGTLDPMSQKAAGLLVNESDEGKYLTITFTVEDWAKASMFITELFSMRKNSDTANVTGVIFKKIDYDQDLDHKTKIGENVIKLLESLGYNISLNRDN